MINNKFCTISLAFLLCACGKKSNSQSGGNSNKEQQKEGEHNPDRQVDPATQQGDIDTNGNGKNGQNKPNGGNEKDKNDKITSKNKNKEIPKKRDENSPTGLRNLGASCYLNSSIQQLYNIEPIRKAVLNGKFNGNDKLKALQELFKGMSSDSSSFDPNDLPNKLGYQGKQEDASEFLLSLLDALGNGNAEIKKEIFFSHYSRTVRNCKHVSTSSLESGNILFLGINKDNLVGCLDEYFSAEQLNGTNQVGCDQCKKKVDAVKNELLTVAPQTFIVALNRFQSGDCQCSKKNDKVSFPLDLKIKTEWCAEELSKNIPSYTLTGVIVHSGSCEGGHYWSYVKTGEKWYKCNDDTVSEVHMDDSLLNSLYGDGKKSDSAYILFYSKAE